jgi:hypothetical protein
VNLSPKSASINRFYGICPESISMIPQKNSQNAVNSILLLKPNLMAKLEFKPFTILGQ